MMSATISGGGSGLRILGLGQLASSSGVGGRRLIVATNQGASRATECSLESALHDSWPGVEETNTSRARMPSGISATSHCRNRSASRHGMARKSSGSLGMEPEQGHRAYAGHI